MSFFATGSLTRPWKSRPTPTSGPTASRTALKRAAALATAPSVSTYSILEHAFIFSCL